MNPLAHLAGLAVDRALGMSAPHQPVVIRRDVGVAMPDGVVLLGDHYRPARELGPLPVVLIRSPYGRAGLAGTVFAAPIARRGFQVFIQSARGTFGSGGQFRPFLHERDDGLATVAWLREQPWCNGRVAMIGASYLGHTQWAIAPYVDPPLESVSLNITAARITSAFYEQGAPGLRNALNWTGQIGRQERGVLPSVVPNPVLLVAMRRALRKTPLQAADVAVAGGPVPFWRDFVDHAASGDDFWAVADHDGADLTRLPPVSMVTGWWDLFVAEQLRDYAAIRAAGVEARLVVGPWLHGEPGEVKAIAQADVAWLRHHLSGGPAPAGPPVRVYLQHGDTWLDFEDWPPPATGAVYYLRQDGELAPDAEPGDARPASFVYDPADPTPTAGGPVLQPPGKQVDNAPIEARPDVLTYTSEPLAADQDVVGPVSARIYVRTALPYADVFVRLCDVDEKDVSRNVVDGIRRLSPQTVPGPDVEVGSDGVLAVDVALYPTAYRMRAGHRIRLQVSGGAFPRYARNHGTGEPIGAAIATHRCRFEVFADAQHQARVVLPLLSPPTTFSTRP
jgi:putative CocE/NonD family hydrolase